VAIGLVCISGTAIAKTRFLYCTMLLIALPASLIAWAIGWKIATELCIKAAFVLDKVDIFHNSQVFIYSSITEFFLPLSFTIAGLLIFKFYKHIQC